LDNLAEAIHTGLPSVSPVVENELHPNATWPLVFADGGTVLCSLIAVGIGRNVKFAKTA
jgi:hypothetical protein